MRNVPLFMAFAFLAVVTVYELYRGHYFEAVFLTLAAGIVSYTNLKSTDYPYSRRVFNILIFISIMLLTFLMMSWLMP